MSLSLLVDEKFNIVEMHSIKSIHYWWDQALSLVYECASDFDDDGAKMVCVAVYNGAYCMFSTHSACTQTTWWGGSELNGTMELAGIPEYLTDRHMHRCRRTSHMYSVLKRLHSPHSVQPSLVHQIVTRIYFVDFFSQFPI